MMLPLIRKLLSAGSNLLSWVTTDNSYEYFNDNGVKIYEEPLDESDLNVVYTFDNKGNIRVLREGIVENENYTISSTDNKNYLNFLRQDASIEIISISNTEIVLSDTYFDDEYIENGVAKTAAKAVYTVKLKKQ